MPRDTVGFPEVEFASPRVSPPVNNDPVLDVLVAGRARIEAGWCKRALHQMTKNGPQFCALGAVVIDVADQIVGARAAGYLHNALPDGLAFLPDFNNAPTTKRRDVLALFDRAIAARRSA